MLSDLSPELQGVVVGGLLTIGGSVVSLILSHWLQSGKEDQRLLRDHAVKYFEALYEQFAWFDMQGHKLLCTAAARDTPALRAFDRACLIQELYLPDLFDEHMAVGDAATKAADVFYEAATMDSPTVADEAYRKTVMGYYEAMHMARLHASTIIPGLRTSIEGRLGLAVSRSFDALGSGVERLGKWGKQPLKPRDRAVRPEGDKP